MRIVTETPYSRLRADHDQEKVALELHRDGRVVLTVAPASGVTQAEYDREIIVFRLGAGYEYTMEHGKGQIVSARRVRAWVREHAQLFKAVLASEEGDYDAEFKLAEAICNASYEGAL